LGLNRILKTKTIDEFMNIFVDENGEYNPLHYACLQGQFQIVHLLLKMKANPTFITKREKAYAIHLFLESGFTKAMEATEKSNTSANDNDEALEQKYNFIVPVIQRLLIGIPINAKTNSGMKFCHIILE
jgi:ankyrin repeat protein